MGNQALSMGLIAAAQKSGLPLFLGSYPITPASDILHELSKYKNFGIKTFQAEDEIAGIDTVVHGELAYSFGADKDSLNKAQILPQPRWGSICVRSDDAKRPDLLSNYMHCHGALYDTRACVLLRWVS